MSYYKYKNNVSKNALHKINLPASVFYLQDDESADAAEPFYTVEIIMWVLVGLFALMTTACIVVSVRLYKKRPNLNVTMDRKQPVVQASQEGEPLTQNGTVAGNNPVWFDYTGNGQFKHF